MIWANLALLHMKFTITSMLMLLLTVSAGGLFLGGGGWASSAERMDSPALAQEPYLNRRLDRISQRFVHLTFLPFVLKSYCHPRVLLLLTVSVPTSSAT